MGRGPLAALIAVLCVGALAAWSYLDKPREVIVSTPSAYTGITVPLGVPGKGEACADEILFDTNAEIARFGATAPAGAKAPGLEVVAQGYDEGAYRNDYKEVARVAGGWTGTRQLDVRLDPPDSAAFGRFCVRNLGDDPVELVGSEDGRAFSRPTVRVNGEQVATELELRFVQDGQSSLLSRLGQITAHAATLRPFGAWWWWLLALALVTAAPLGVALVIRSALTADAALARDGRAPMAGWPSERLRRRAAAIPGWAIVAAVGALAVAWFCYWSFSTHVFQNDEDQYVYLSRWLQDDFPASLWNFDAYGRGLQRLEVWLLAIPGALFDSPWSLIGGRFLNTVAFVSTAVPVYLLGRGMGLRSQWAALPASVSVLVPWAVVTTGLLTENIAYPICFWIVWAIWRTATEPSPRRDLLALVLLVVGGGARSGLLLLVPVLPIIVAGTGVRCGSGPLLARIRTVLREHVVLWAAVGLAALGLLLGPLGVDAADGVARRLAGGYQTQVGFDPLDLLARMGRYLSKTVVGTGFFAAAVGLPWVAIQLVRARDPRRFAFALIVVVLGLALLYSLNTAGPDERYVLYLAPLVLLPATLAIANREVSPLALGIGSVLMALLVLRVPWNGEQGPFGYFVAPVEMFYARAVGLRLSGVIPGDGTDALALVGLVLGATGVALAVVLRRAPGRLGGNTGALLVAGVVAAVLVQTHYALTKYCNGAGSKSAAGLSARAFADRLVPDDATVGAFLEGAGQRPDFFPLWQEAQFYNQRVETAFALGPNVNPIPPGDDLVQGVEYDERTGRVRSPVPLADYLVIPTQVGAVRLRGEIVHAPSYISLALQRVAQPATLEWRTEGFEQLGRVPASGTGSIRFYGAELDPGAQCATLTLAAPPDAEVAWSVRRRGGPVESGTLAPGERGAATVALPQLVERGFADVSVSGDGLQVLTAGVGC